MTDPGTDLPRTLVWSDGTEPGLRRRRAGKGFVYLRADGTKASRQEVERIRALAIPPAWTDVWICADACGRLQATGRDAKGRKQYRYHPGYRAHRDAMKFGHLVDFGAALADIRRRVAHDLAQPGLPKEKVVAVVVRLLEATLVRVGNEEYARANGSFGLTTLRNRHARFSPTALQLVFRAKHGRDTDVVVTDRRLRHLVKQCQDLPGQVLFQYVDDTGEPRPVSSTDVNDYLRAITQLPVTAKDFRTWMGTLLATCELVSYPKPTSEADARAQIAHALDQVSSELGNTRAVCRASYVHPRVVEWFCDGTLPDRWDRVPVRGSRQLIPEERKLLALLRIAEGRRNRRAA